MTLSRLSIYIVSAALFGLAALLLYRGAATANDTPQYRLASVERGAIRLAVAATGVINPVQTVEVGSQVSGQIAELSADYNTAVKAEQVIARIDPAPFQARLDVARADLAVARANVAIQDASLTELRADIAGAEAMLVQAEADYARKRELRQRGTTSQSVVDLAKATLADAMAKLDSARARLQKQAAQVDSAKAQVQARQATGRERELDLEHTVIRSPVDGVVIDRNVDIGQTVAASLQAPVLFTIAEDLRRMQVEISVDEADIGRVREGQAIDFTVDAFPARQFVGSVTQIRKKPSVESNVVTYTVVALADNPDLALLPGMTANVNIVVGERQDVLKIPEAALRFKLAGAKPASATTSPEERREAIRARLTAVIKNLIVKLKLDQNQREEVKTIVVETAKAIRQIRSAGSEQGEEQGNAAVDQLRAQARQRITRVLNEEQKQIYRQMNAERDSGSTRRGEVWLLDGESDPRPIRITVGISDDTTAELLRGEIEEGAKLIVGLAAPAAGR